MSDNILVYVRRGTDFSSSGMLHLEGFLAYLNSVAGNCVYANYEEEFDLDAYGYHVDPKDVSRIQNLLKEKVEREGLDKDIKVLI